jgi:hypothetical protein
MKKYGYKGVVFIIPSYIDNLQGYMTLKQLRDLDNNGWDISGHYYGNLLNKSDSELDGIYYSVKRWLVHNKFTGEQSDLFAYPQGVHDGNIEQVIKKYFSVARTVKDTNET